MCAFHLKCTWCAWVWYCYVTEWHAYDFVMKTGCYMCWTLHINSELDKKPSSHRAYILMRVEWQTVRSWITKLILRSSQTVIGVRKTIKCWTVIWRKRVTLNREIRRVFEEVTSPSRCSEGTSNRTVPTPQVPSLLHVFLLSNHTFHTRPGGTFSWTFLASAKVACPTQPSWVTLGWLLILL